MTLGFWKRSRNTSPIVPLSNSETHLVSPGDEARLVRAAQTGDRDAFDALCAMHTPLLRGFISRRVSADMVDDVVQETLLGAWLRIAHFTPQARFKTWLYQIALHKSIDANRARTRKGEHEQIAFDGNDDFAPASNPSASPRPFPQPGDALEADERRKAILAALDQIPAGQREVVILYFYGELTLPEIAQKVGRNLSTVKYQFYAAHTKIADLLIGTPWAVSPAKPSKSSAPMRDEKQSAALVHLRPLL